MAWLQQGNVGSPAAAVAAKIAASPSSGIKEDAVNTSGILSMYMEPPGADLTIEDFERFAIDRLRVLKGIETDKARGFSVQQVADKACEQARVCLQSGKMVMEASAQFKDECSHFVLRLAYCRTEELRRWFLGQESDLFRARFLQLTPKQQASFVQEQRLDYEIVDRAELDSLRSLLADVEESKTYAKPGSMEELLVNKIRNGSPDVLFFKVDFECVPDLVAGRKVLLRRGKAYISSSDLASLVVGTFRAELSKAMVAAAARYSSHIAVIEAERLTPVIEALSSRYLGATYDGSSSGKHGVVTGADVPRLAYESFPLCMLNLYEHLHSSHHLKHDGRHQLRLFLKGIGMTLENHIEFWRREMAPKTPEDKFRKDHLYNIRHAHGKEGGRKDYTPMNCLTIISKVPGNDQFHGCPYRTFNATSLTAALGRLKLPAEAVSEAAAKAKAGHFQLACAAAWEGQHSCSCDTGINHPNQYFDESRKVREGDGGQVQAQPANAKQQAVPADAQASEGMEVDEPHQQSPAAFGTPAQDATALAPVQHSPPHPAAWPSGGKPGGSSRLSISTKAHDAMG